MAYKSKHTGQEIDAAVDDAKKIGALVRDIGDLQAKNVQQDERLDTAERTIRDNSDGLVQARGILSETQEEVTQVKNKLMNGLYPALEGFGNHLATIDKSLYANTEEHKQFNDKHAEIEIKMSRMDAMIAAKGDKVREYTIVNEGGDLFSMDKIVYAGTYRIKGEHTRTDDGLPLATTGGGYTVDAMLTVLNSSLENGTGEGDDYCVTQILNLSNRVGGDGNVYVRTAQSADGRQWTWEPWGKLQTNIEVGQTYSLDNYKDNGIYSGVYTGRQSTGTSVYETFVMIVINNYAIAGATGNERSIAQLKYAVNVDGTITVKKRTGRGDSTITWDNVWLDVDEDANNKIYDRIERVEANQSWAVDFGVVSSSGVAEDRAVQLANDTSVLFMRYTTSDGRVGTIRQVHSENQGTMQYLTFDGTEYARIVYSNSSKSVWRNINKSSLVYKLQYNETTRVLSFHDPIQDEGFGGVTLPPAEQVIYTTPQEFRGQHKWGSFFMNIENVNTRSDFRREDGTTGSLEDSYGNNKRMEDGIYEYLKRKQISPSHQYCHAGIKVECFDGKLFADIIVKSGMDGMLLFATIICDLAIAGDYNIVVERDIRET